MKLDHYLGCFRNSLCQHLSTFIANNPVVFEYRAKDHYEETK